MTDEVRPVRSTNIGSWPGTDPIKAVQVAFAECPELPYLPELPARGPHAEMIGRATAVLPGLEIDLQPAGWRLSGGTSRERRQAAATLRSDLDVLEEHAQGYAGLLKVSVAGPWTLAATVELPRGDRVVSDSGARRDLGQSLAAGVADLVADLRRRLPDCPLVLQLDEPLLPAVLAGSLRTASGLSRHQAVDRPEVGATIAALVHSAGAETAVAVHCCAAGAPIDLLRQAGVRAVAVDLSQLGSEDWDAIGTALEAGMWLGAGAHPREGALSPDEVARRVLRPVTALGLEPTTASRIVLTPACGLAGLAAGEAVGVLRTLRTAAGIVTEALASG